VASSLCVSGWLAVSAQQPGRTRLRLDQEPMYGHEWTYQGDMPDSPAPRIATGNGPASRPYSGDRVLPSQPEADSGVVEETPSDYEAGSVLSGFDAMPYQPPVRKTLPPSKSATAGKSNGPLRSSGTTKAPAISSSPGPSNGPAYSNGPAAARRAPSSIPSRPANPVPSHADEQDDPNYYPEGDASTGPSPSVASRPTIASSPHGASKIWELRSQAPSVDADPEFDEPQSAPERDEFASSDESPSPRMVPPSLEGFGRDQAVSPNRAALTRPRPAPEIAYENPAPESAHEVEEGPARQRVMPAGPRTSPAEYEAILTVHPLLRGFGEENVPPVNPPKQKVEPQGPLAPRAPSAPRASGPAPRSAAPAPAMSPVVSYPTTGMPAEAAPEPAESEPVVRVERPSQPARNAPLPMAPQPTVSAVPHAQAPPARYVPPAGHTPVGPRASAPVPFVVEDVPPGPETIEPAFGYGPPNSAPHQSSPAIVTATDAPSLPSHDRVAPGAVQGFAGPTPSRPVAGHIPSSQEWLDSGPTQGKALAPGNSSYNLPSAPASGMHGLVMQGPGPASQPEPPRSSAPQKSSSWLGGWNPFQRNNSGTAEKRPATSKSSAQPGNSKAASPPKNAASPNRSSAQNSAGETSNNAGVAKSSSPKTGSRPTLGSYFGSGSGSGWFGMGNRGTRVPTIIENAPSQTAPSQTAQPNQNFERR